jgi:hypothetical protein
MRRMLFGNAKLALVVAAVSIVLSGSAFQEFPAAAQENPPSKAAAQEAKPGDDKKQPDENTAEKAIYALGGKIGRSPVAAENMVTSVDLGRKNVTDAWLKELSGLTHLQNLDLRFTKVTDAGMKELAGLKSLQVLSLGNTRVTDAGLKELAPLVNLIEIGLTNTKVTDEGLKELAAHKQLRTLWLQQTQVTYAGVSELNKALPNCQIESRFKGTGNVGAVASNAGGAPSAPRGWLAGAVLVGFVATLLIAVSVWYFMRKRGSNP